jgi:hypothetical protein
MKEIKSEKEYSWKRDFMRKFCDKELQMLHSTTDLENFLKSKCALRISGFNSLPN